MVVGEFITAALFCLICSYRHRSCYEIAPEGDTNTDISKQISTIMRALHLHKLPLISHKAQTDHLKCFILSVFSILASSINKLEQICKMNANDGFVCSMRVLLKKVYSDKVYTNFWSTTRLCADTTVQFIHMTQLCLIKC